MGLAGSLRVERSVEGFLAEGTCEQSSRGTVQARCGERHPGLGGAEYEGGEEDTEDVEREKEKVVWNNTVESYLEVSSF